MINRHLRGPSQNTARHMLAGSACNALDEVVHTVAPQAVCTLAQLWTSLSSQSSVLTPSTPSLSSQVDPKFLRNQRYAKHGTEKAVREARAAAREATA